MSLLDSLQQILTHLGFQVTVKFLVLLGPALARLLPVCVCAVLEGAVPDKPGGLAVIMWRSVWD
jgi:hypothetical protein